MAKRSKRRDLVIQRKAVPRALAPVDDSRGWMTIYNSGGRGTFDGTGGWFQQDVTINPMRCQANWVVFACQTLIAGDMGKMDVELFEEVDGVHQEVDSNYSRLLNKPNGFQTWQQFMERWSLSKTSRGNTYVLLSRDRSTRVDQMFVLDPDRVTPLVAEDGSVYYRLVQDDIQTVHDEVVVPASEIMHDRFNCLFHPLVGLSPLYACGLAATQGLAIQNNSALFFGNSSRPGGVLTTPGQIGNEDAQRYKAQWEASYGGANQGRTAVLGNGLSYQAIAQNAVDSELVAQLKLSAEMICSTFHVPAYKVGVGATPTYQNAEILNQIYYDDCLQTHIEAVESLLDAGLGLGDVDGRELEAKFCLDDLMRMDSATQIKTLNDSVAGGWLSPNEARAKRGLGPVVGGKSPMIQQQNYSLAALDKRDSSEDPFKTNSPAPAPMPAPAANDPNAEDAAAAKFFSVLARKFMEPVARVV